MRRVAKLLRVKMPSFGKLVSVHFDFCMSCVTYSWRLLKLVASLAC